jgi:hypothetical protein
MKILLVADIESRESLRALCAFSSASFGSA